MIASGSRPARRARARLGGALGEQLALGEDDEGGFVDGEAVFQRGHGDGEPAPVRACAGTTADEGREIGHDLRLQLGRLQHLEQCLAPAR